MHIEDWPLDRIRPYPNNPRVLRNAAEKVAESIREFGWRQPIVVDQDGVVIIGHARLAAAKLLKLEAAPVHIAEGLDAGRVRALRIADNKTGEFSGWDEQKLMDELAVIMDGLGTVVVIDADPMHRMMSTVRHNRARGTHAVLRMAEIVRDMVQAGLPAAEICERLGMEDEELERLLDRSGMTVRGTGNAVNFGRAWIPSRNP